MDSKEKSGHNTIVRITRAGHSPSEATDLDLDELSEAEEARGVRASSTPSEGADDFDAGSNSLLYEAPSSISDFTERWVTEVMSQYYTTRLGKALPCGIGKFSVEMAGNNATKNDADDSEVQVSSSRHIMSAAFRVIVEVPDSLNVTTSTSIKKNESQTEDLSGNKGEEQTSESFTDQEQSTKIHHLFVKVPPKQSAKFERMVRRNRTLEHEVNVYKELLTDLLVFIKERVGDTITLNIPTLYHGFTDSNNTTFLNANNTAARDQSVLVIEDLARQGFVTKDWFKCKLTHNEVLLALTELAKLHACGLAYRMSLKEEIDEKYPYIEDDLYTSSMAKELLAKYLDSYLHFLSHLPGLKSHVHKIRKISTNVFELLLKLRRPTDPLGTRFNTICHGDMWMGNLMFSSSNHENLGESEKCYIIDFHSAQFLSPATDLAHLLLTSTSREYLKQHYNEVVQHYYNVFNRTLAEFGLVLRHLGTTYQDFLYEVKRALRGQFLCVAFIIPIVVYCGPTEWRFERRRGSSVDRKNTIRHLIQMMAITEEHLKEPDEAEENSGSEEDEFGNIPVEFMDLYNDEELKQTLIDLILTASDLDILDFQEFCQHIETPKPMWRTTQETTRKHIPIY